MYENKVWFMLQSKQRIKSFNLLITIKSFASLNVLIETVIGYFFTT